MKKLFAKLILKIIGWKVVLQGDVDNLNRCILVAAPHTHNSESGLLGAGQKTKNHHQRCPYQKSFLWLDCKRNRRNRD